jgi:hypothetical protein
VPAVRPADPRASRGTTVALDRLALAGGLWLIAAPFVLGYPTTGTAFRAYWNDVAVGLAVVGVLVPRVAVPARTASRLTAAALALGAWLVAAPFALGFAADVVRAAVNDVLVGIALVVLAALAVPRSR